MLRSWWLIMGWWHMRRWRRMGSLRMPKMIMRCPITVVAVSMIVVGVARFLMSIGVTAT